MGEMVSYRSNGEQAQGYLAVPSSGSGPGLLVVQEWWGLVPQLLRTCDRLADEGFVALAPDLFHGQLTEHMEIEKAQQLMQEMPPDRAARDMAGAVDYLLDSDRTTGSRIGTIGFCMGGGLALFIGAEEGERVGAIVSFYGAPRDPVPDWSKLAAPVQGHFGTQDQAFPPDLIRSMEQQLADLGKSIESYWYDAGHAFGNEDNALGTYDQEAASLAWQRSIQFLREKLG
jgi:carboxymethylenebutenolidase